MAEFLYALPDERLDDRRVCVVRYPVDRYRTAYPDEPRVVAGDVLQVHYSCIAHMAITTRKITYHCNREITVPCGTVVRDAWVQSTLPHEGRQPSRRYTIVLTQPDPPNRPDTYPL